MKQRGGLHLSLAMGSLLELVQLVSWLSKLTFRITEFQQALLLAHFEYSLLRIGAAFSSCRAVDMAKQHSGCRMFHFSANLILIVFVFFSREDKWMGR